MDNNTPTSKGKSNAYVDSKQSIYGQWIDGKEGWPECPRCGFGARKDEYSGEPTVSNFCPDCGLQLMFQGTPTMGRPYNKVKEAMYFRKIDKSIEAFKNGDIVVKTMEELEAMV